MLTVSRCLHLASRHLASARNVRQDLIGVPRPRKRILASVELHVGHVRFPTVLREAVGYIWSQAVSAGCIHFVRDRNCRIWAGSVYGPSKFDTERAHG